MKTPIMNCSFFIRFPLLRATVGLLLVGLLMVGLVPMARGLETQTLNFTSTYDGSAQTAYLQLPDNYETSSTLPLLVWVQGMGTPPSHGLSYIGSQAAERGWLLLVATMHGERTSGLTNLGAPAAQRDLIDALERVKRDYKVDRTRVWLAGISMGGLTGGLVLGNYPNRFAAAVLLMGISDLEAWYDETKDSYAAIANSIVAECGGTPTQVPDEYVRRSVLAHASILADMPIYISHGSNDTLVPTSHSQNLIDAIEQHDPAMLEVVWFDGGHEENKIDKTRFLDFLSQYATSGLAGVNCAGTWLNME